MPPRGGSATVPRLGATPYSAAQMRTATAALELFAAHGVSGTSLQMIADAVGVTKAAVYHQFKTKEAVVVAAVTVELGLLEPALEAAEAAEAAEAVEDEVEDPSIQVKQLLARVIDLAIGRRRLVSSLQHDPVIVRLLAQHHPFQQFMQRLFRALLGGRDDSTRRTQVAMVASAIGGAVTHPLVADLDDATLRAELLHLSVIFLDLPQ